MAADSWQLRKLEEDWWRWRILCWVRDSFLFTWITGALLMLFDEEKAKGFGFALLWLGLAGWPIIMVLGWRWQEKAKDVEQQYRPYIRGWFSWQAVGWVVLGIGLVVYARSFVTPSVMIVNHRSGEHSFEIAEGRLIVVTYTDVTANHPSAEVGVGHFHLAWERLSNVVTSGRSSLRGETTMRHSDGRMLKCQYVVIPLVALLPLALVWPIAWGGRIRSVERRRKANQCPNCGYDLRESPQQCPECGQAVMRLMDDGLEQLEESEITPEGM